MSHYLIKLPHREGPNQYLFHHTKTDSMLSPADRARRFDTAAKATEYAATFYRPEAYTIEEVPDLQGGEAGTLAAPADDRQALVDLLRECHPFLGHAICTIPDDNPDYAKAHELMRRISPIISPEVHAAFAEDAKRHARRVSP